MTGDTEPRGVWELQGIGSYDQITVCQGGKNHVCGDPIKLLSGQRARTFGEKLRYNINGNDRQGPSLDTWLIMVENHVRVTGVACANISHLNYASSTAG